MKKLQMAPSREFEVEVIESLIRKQEPVDGVVRILEAGCGKMWHLKLEGVDYRLTGVDLDAKALEIRKDVLNDLHDTIVGDLRTVDLGAAKFDVIYNAFVLEHISGAQQVLESFLRWTRPGGLIVIRIPDPDSVQGFITRVTPHWFHVFYYRRILNNKLAGQPGYAPYPTYYDHVVSRRGLLEFCEQHGMTIEAEYGDGYAKSARGPMQTPIEIIKSVVAALSLGRLSRRHNNLLVVMRVKKESSEAPQSQPPTMRWASAAHPA